jgi:hypothetical protein
MALGKLSWVQIVWLPCSTWPSAATTCAAKNAPFYSSLARQSTPIENSRKYEVAEKLRATIRNLQKMLYAV